MDFDKLLLISNVFKKTAAIKENMAKRIFFSLLSKLVPLGETARIPWTKGAIDFQALKALIPGAKELVEYGTIACLQEAEFYGSPRFGRSWHPEKEKKYLAAEKNVNAKNYSTALKQMVEIFGDEDYWGEGAIGGKLWQRIAQTILEIDNALQQYYALSKTNNYEGQQQALMEMTAYMNILDGLAHNTGSIMEKLVNLEKEEFDLEEDQLPEITRLMDAKELEDYKDVMEEVLPILAPPGKYIEQSGLKDWLQKAVRTRQPTDDKRREKELAFIRAKKGFQELKGTLDEYKRFIKKVENERTDFGKNLHFFATGLPVISGLAFHMKGLSTKLKKQNPKLALQLLDTSAFLYAEHSKLNNMKPDNRKIYNITAMLQELKDAIKLCEKGIEDFFFREEDYDYLD